jgi:CubicO group peptidase (beta-lactamase class C family)
MKTELLEREIAGPLGLKDTAVWLSPEQKTRLIQAYGRHHNPARLGPGRIRAGRRDRFTW